MRERTSKRVFGSVMISLWLRPGRLQRRRLSHVKTKLALRENRIALKPNKQQQQQTNSLSLPHHFVSFNSQANQSTWQLFLLNFIPLTLNETTKISSGELIKSCSSSFRARQSDNHIPQRASLPSISCSSNTINTNITSQTEKVEFFLTVYHLLNISY